MLNHSALKVIVSAALLGVSLAGSARGMEFSEPQYAAQDRSNQSLALTAASLNASLGDYAYTQLPQAAADERDQALVTFMRGAGMRYLWQVNADGALCNVWYSPDADVSVVVVHRVGAQGLVSLEAFTLAGRLEHKNMLLL